MDASRGQRANIYSLKTQDIAKEQEAEDLHS